MKRLEALLEWGGTKKEIALLARTGAALLLSIAGVRPAGIDPAWAAIVLCGIPILLEAFIGLVTAFDIKADVLVSLALVASVVIGEHFAAGEVAFIMQLGALLEDLTVAARGRALKSWCISPRARRAACAGARRRSSPPSRCAWAICCAFCRARPSRWTASSPREILRWIRP